MLYLAIDPFCQNEIFNRVADRILHEMIFATLLSVFLILLLIWTALYNAIMPNIKFFDSNNVIQPRNGN